MLTTSPSSGLEGMVAGESAICSIDEEKSELRYRGYMAEELSEGATYEEVAYLLLKGDLPSSQALEVWKDELVQASILPALIFQWSGMVPPNAHPMDILRTGVSLLGMVDLEKQIRRDVRRSGLFASQGRFAFLSGFGSMERRIGPGFHPSRPHIPVVRDGTAQRSPHGHPSHGGIFARDGRS